MRVFFSSVRISCPKDGTKCFSFSWGNFLQQFRVNVPPVWYGNPESALLVIFFRAIYRDQGHIVKQLHAKLQAHSELRAQSPLH